LEKWSEQLRVKNFYFIVRIVNIWNSLPNYIVDVDTVGLFKARQDKYWFNLEIKLDFTAHWQ